MYPTFLNVLMGYHIMNTHQFSSVQFSLSVMSDSLRPHELQHARPPCPSRTTGVYPNPCPLSRWCHPTISSSVVPFSSCSQCFPASGSFPVNWLFARDSEESSPAPQFESINSLVLNLDFCPTLTSIHDYWKNHSFDYMDLFGKVMFFLFLTRCLDLT